ncbi:hypothetical protein CAEBREN_29519 [Caenorhabditis brenneri]|uniref:Hpc2-related domain-containing protein n=1 Tax=Caenorhabditis brenneri TaxID=135651 RepID=G0NI55_CAEBE|nr:hypothetical protein CAEBREN_29519 [Caenorhabditis brenneri]
MDTISGTKKKKKGGKETKAELIQMRIVVSKPGSKKYTHSDYNDILRANGKARNEEEQSRFYDEDTLMMAKKIGETKTKSGKKIRINLDELQHYNRNCGYDMDDDFIDDTEAVDDGNFSSRKGRFYVGKGDVKDMNDLDDDDEESEEEEVIPEKPPKKKKFMQPPPQKKDKEKNGVEKPSRSSSDSDSEAEEQPVRRMAGAPPSKRLLAPPPAKKDPTPPKTMEPAKKKPSPPAVSSSSSQSSDIVCLDDEPPVKKQKLPEKPAPSTSSESNGSSGSSAAPPKGNNKGCAVTLLAKQICKQQEELKKKDTATSSASTDSSLMETLKALRIKLSESLVKKGKIYQEKGLKSFDDATLIELFQYVELLKHQKSSENLELSIQHVAQSFGLTGAEVLKRMETTNMTDSLEWKLTQADLPFLTDAEINSISAQVKAWRSTKEITNSVLTKWLKEVNQQKMNADQARNKLFELIVGLPNVDKPQEAPVELPKHERSRKARMFLNQWVYLSRKYVTMILPKLKKPIPTDGFAKKQVTAVEFLKDHVKKKREQFEIKKARGDHPEDVQFMFSFNDPVLAAIHTYLEEVCDYSLSVGKLSTIVHSIDSLYKAVEGSIPQHIFYIELCRRLQKLTFLLVEEPIKSRLKAKGESVNRHQVVQNPKYQIKWPNGEEPSLRGLNSELQDFETSIMPPTKHAPPTSATLTAPLRQSTTPNTAPKAATAPSADDLKRQQSMNQILQSINISDASQCPISDEILLLIVTAVSTVGIGLPDQMAMFKNILCNVGQARMALSVAKQKGRTDLKLTSSDYQKIFEFFSTLDKTAARNKLKTLKIQEENTRKLEEKQKKEKEKLLEKEKKEQEKREEKERKEKEKREEKERKEREMKEMAERKRKEEEDRLIAKARLMQQMEDQRRKKEAEEAVEKELERRAKLEKEEANALQGLEEDLLMDDYDFVTEQQSKVDEERKIREAQRATERENQIKLMRAQQLQRRKEDEVPVAPVPEPEPPRHEERPKEAEFTPPSSSSFDNRRNPPKPSDSSSSNIDILSAAQEAADLDFPKPAEVQAPRPMSAMEKLASLRGRTMSADMKRERDLGSPSASQHQQIVVNMQGNGSPYIAPTTPTTQHFFPSSSSQSYQDPMMPSHQQQQQQQQQQQNQFPQQQPTFNSSPMNQRLQNSSVINHQMNQMGQMNQVNQMQQQQPRLPSTSSSGNMYYPDVELREPNKRSMSMSQPLSHLPQQQPQHQSSPQNVQQQQFPINSYQSPVNNTHQMNNSSLMHTPHSNSSMVSQSPQFSSHPVRISEYFFYDF